MMSEPEMVRPLFSGAVREPPPTGLPLTVSVLDIVASPLTVRLLAEDRLDVDN